TAPASGRGRACRPRAAAIAPSRIVERTLPQARLPPLALHRTRPAPLRFSDPHPPVGMRTRYDPALDRKPPPNAPSVLAANRFRASPDTRRARAPPRHSILTSRLTSVRRRRLADARRRDARKTAPLRTREDARPFGPH